MKSTKKIKTLEPNASQEALTMTPGWVKPFLSTKFYSDCPMHPNSPQKECKMFCVSCRNDAFCCHCRTSLHSDHTVLQIRRLSYENVVGVMEVEKVLDIREVQTYVINKKRAVYLHQRVNKKPTTNGSPSRICVVCDRSLLNDDFLFCSLACKFGGSMEKNGNSASPEEESCHKNGEKRQSHKWKDKGKPGESPPSNSRKRKGIPRRAPLAGHLERVLNI